MKSVLGKDFCQSGVLGGKGLPIARDSVLPGMQPRQQARVGGLGSGTRRVVAVEDDSFVRPVPGEGHSTRPGFADFRIGFEAVASQGIECDEYHACGAGGGRERRRQILRGVTRGFIGSRQADKDPDRVTTGRA